MNISSKKNNFALMILHVFFSFNFVTAGDSDGKINDSKSSMICRGAPENISWCFIDLPGVDHREASPLEFVDTIKGIQIESISGKIVPNVVVGKMNGHFFTHKQAKITLLELLTRFAIQTGNQVVINGYDLHFGEFPSKKNDSK